MMAECERLKARLLGKADSWLTMSVMAEDEEMNEFEDFLSTLDDLISAVADAAKHGAV